jgi:hypothetical protein
VIDLIVAAVALGRARRADCHELLPRWRGVRAGMVSDGNTRIRGGYSRTYSPLASVCTRIRFDLVIRPRVSNSRGTTEV